MSRRLALVALLCLGATVPQAMVLIPGGTYTPLYTLTSKADRKGKAPELVGKEVRVAPFRLDRYPVTNRDYLAFLRERPEWRKSKIKRIFAEPDYLQKWPSDLEPPAAEEDSPVVFVSWFAARAYCKWRGKRLPRFHEWEFAAQASEISRDGHRQREFRERVLAWYGKPNPATLPRVGTVFRNYYGVHDMHGLVWEWVDDFNTSMVTGESRGDGGLDRGLFCAAGVTGSTDPSDYATYMRYSFRASLKARYTVGNLGFRAAAEATP